MNQNKVIGYRVQVKRLQHKPGTREVMQFAIDTFETKTTSTIISQQLGS